MLHDIIVIGASAGGVEVLAQIVRDLPAGLPASLFIVCHFPAGSRSVLPEILSRSGPLLAVHARDGDPIYPSQIYVAPPDRHLLVEHGHVRVEHGPRENSHRPAIDPLFRSAARVYGPRVIGVVLSGALYDGVAGLLAVRTAGGIGVVQDPADACVAALPLSAARVAGADHVVAAAGLAPLLENLVRQPSQPKGDTRMIDSNAQLIQTQVQDAEAQARGERRGNLSVFTCPECGGSLWQMDEKDVVRFRCHVGHAYQAEMLLAEQAEILEAALWTAVRGFKDRAVLSRQLANQEREKGNLEAAARFDERAEQAQRYSASIQQYLLNGSP
ncbi:MAG TPA: chemotaxis protein CheB [Gemmataceae bacterium]|nr:chemotaxis protein CheB [Gemmataceae bacterium]